MERPTGQSDLLQAKVIEIKDGDGAFVSTSHGIFEIRLAAIDCPEDDQRGGDYAKERLRWLIDGRDVYLEIHDDQQDFYGRTLVTVYLDVDSKLININEEMVKCGHAWVYRRFYNHLSEHRRKALDNIEAWAKRNRVGLWKYEVAIPPWDFRLLKKSWKFNQA